MPEPIRLQQAVFGYREGHNLLASSVPLAPKARHLLATMTDASGAETDPAFARAYTGLPVPETDYYALFCTWLAPEMPRPGCVWSHVILIELSDLARIENLGTLRALLRRPNVTSPITGYEDVMTLPEAKRRSRTGATASAAAVLAALYGKPDAGVVLLAESAEQWEDTVFALWSQQWPRLRRNFAFSTGSLGDRRLAGANFDLQIAPLSTGRLWHRNASPTTVIESNVSLQTPIDQGHAWLTIALKDLESEKGPPPWPVSDDANTLRDFLCRYGSDIAKPRHAFSRLVTVYQAIFENEQQTLEQKLHAVGAAFPEKREALRLKEWLVAEPSMCSETEALERAWEVASFLLDAPEASAYESVTFNHAEWATRLWRHKRNEILSLFGRLVRHQEKPSTTAFAGAIANALEPEEIPEISSRKPELIPILVSYRPGLAQNSLTWEAGSHTQWQVYEALDGLNLDEGEWSKVEAAMLIAATSTAVREVVRKAGSRAMDGAFRWLQSKVAQEYLPAQNWREALAEPATCLLKEEKALTPSELALCCWMAPPDALRRFVSAARQDVQTLAREYRAKVPKPLQDHTAFLLVTVGLREPTDAGLEPLIRGFFEVHETLASMRASWESWQMLAPELPRLGRWREWDQCEKLRRAVRDWLGRHGKPGFLMQAADTNERRKLAARVADADTDSEEFLD